MWKTLLANILDMFFPRNCINCKRSGSFLCDDCFDLIQVLTWQYCPFCYPSQISSNGLVCLKHKSQNHINSLIAAVPYSDPIAQRAMKLFKYQPYIKQLSIPLATLITSHLKQTHIGSEHFKDFIIVPVPYTKNKEKYRGFKPTYELSLIMSAFLNVPIVDALVKTKDGQSQAGLNKSQRLENVKNAFAIKKEFANNLPNKKILLLDDIFTTGATVNQCANLLKQNGAEFICAMVVAREFLD